MEEETTTTMTIKQITITTDYAKIGRLGQNNGYDFCVDGFQVEFDVVVEDQEFCVILQTEERNDGMKRYTGYEMTWACAFGCDEDESEKLDEINQDFMPQLCEKAEEYCKAWLLLQKPEWIES